MFDPHEACADVTIHNADTGEVVVYPKRKKVALCGFATNTLMTVPWTDPTFEIWGMNQGYLHMKRRAERWFEMHLPDAVPDVRDPQYLQWLKDATLPIYMIERYDWAPMSVRYPIEDALRIANRDYFTSTVAFMLALADMEGFEEVHLYGINLAIGDEWFYEKPCAEYWCGRLEAKGVKLHIPSASSMLKQYRRYGYNIDPRPHQSLKVMLQGRKKDYDQKVQQHSAQLNVWLGASQEDEALMQIFEGLDHGADLVFDPAPNQPLQAATAQAPST
jgi:hypothetical protein